MAPKQLLWSIMQILLSLWIIDQIDSNGSSLEVFNLLYPSSCI